MFRWLIVVFLALLLIQGITPWLEKLVFGREIFLPLTTTIILSMVCAGLSRLL